MAVESTEHRNAALNDAKPHRDVFLEMKIAGNPKYSCFTKNEVAGNICLWEHGSTINWIARRDGYPSPWHARMVVRAAYWAASEWSKIMDGRFVFRYVDRFDDACFMVEYGGDRGVVFADAFFPDDWERTLNTILIFRKCFVSSEIGRLRNVMLHELGHVLGMRHEHAHDGVEGFLPAEDHANGPESVLCGVRNPKSVMAYYRGQRIQNSDVEYLRRAYDELEEGKVLSGKGRLGTVKKIIERVQPNI